MSSVPGSLNENANSGISERLKTLITIYADMGDYYAFLAKLKLKDILAHVTSVKQNFPIIKANHSEILVASQIFYLRLRKSENKQ